jgi:hypothetical protein
MNEFRIFLNHNNMILLKLSKNNGYVDGCSKWIPFHVTAARPAFAFLTGTSTRLAWCAPIHNMFDVVPI